MSSTSPTRVRVRAALITPAGDLLAIRRVRPDRPVYWILPGGHVEPSDSGLLAALHREIAEEVGGRAEIDRLFHIRHESADHVQYFYLGWIESWSAAEQTAPEYLDPAKGEYHLDLIPVTAAGLASIRLEPEPVARLLAAHAARPEGLTGLPRLTRSAAAPPR